MSVNPSIPNLSTISYQQLTFTKQEGKNKLDVFHGDQRIGEVAIHKTGLHRSKMMKVALGDHHYKIKKSKLDGLIGNIAIQQRIEPERRTENQPFAADRKIIDRSARHPERASLPELKENQAWVFFSPLDRKAYANWNDCYNRAGLLAVPLEKDNDGKNLRILSSSELSQIDGRFSNPNTFQAREYGKMLDSFEDIKQALQ